eukprot:365520-Chlamydomonas_euryale.AAC.3
MQILFDAWSHACPHGIQHDVCLTGKASWCQLHADAVLPFHAQRQRSVAHAHRLHAALVDGGHAVTCHALHSRPLHPQLASQWEAAAKDSEAKLSESVKVEWWGPYVWALLEFGALPAFGRCRPWQHLGTANTLSLAAFGLQRQSPNAVQAQTWAKLNCWQSSDRWHFQGLTSTVVALPCQLLGRA